jgi:hypothetical protein
MSLQCMDLHEVQGSITAEHVGSLQRQVVQKKYSSAVALVDGLLKVVAAMLA